MKSKILKIMLLIGCIIFVESTQAQNVTINYQTWDPSNPPCNLFASPTNVPATVNGKATTISHRSRVGQPQYAGGTTKAIS